MYLKFSKCIKDLSKCIQMYPKVSKCIKVYPKVSISIQMYPDVSKSTQKYPKMICNSFITFYKTILNCDCMYTTYENARK